MVNKEDFFGQSHELFEVVDIYCTPFIEPSTFFAIKYLNFKMFSGNYLKT